ncbi:hypothetical protein V6N13_060094 [Hibiscus sabdariffa]|uniref:Uncharacterized protein n=1 Tax=Hibiscus sabdariffa TaxID=183260 RepID=A0ABR2GB13_9ROSI
MGFSNNDLMQNPYLEIPEQDISSEQLQEIQGKSLSTVEKRKRDKPLKKLKKQGFLFEASELEDRSLTDSDLFAQQSFWIREARKTLELGKRVGIQFHGPEDEIVRDIAQLEETSREAR